VLIKFFTFSLEELISLRPNATDGIKKAVNFHMGAFEALIRRIKTAKSKGAGIIALQRDWFCPAVLLRHLE